VLVLLLLLLLLLSFSLSRPPYAGWGSTVGSEPSTLVALRQRSEHIGSACYYSLMFPQPASRGALPPALRSWCGGGRGVGLLLADASGGGLVSLSLMRSGYRLLWSMICAGPVPDLCREPPPADPAAGDAHQRELGRGRSGRRRIGRLHGLLRKGGHIHTPPCAGRRGGEKIMGLIIIRID
jgi:hypothetical protein